MRVVAPRCLVERKMDRGGVCSDGGRRRRRSEGEEAFAAMLCRAANDAKRARRVLRRVCSVHARHRRRRLDNGAHLRRDDVEVEERKEKGTRDFSFRLLSSLLGLARSLSGRTIPENCDHGGTSPFSSPTLSTMTSTNDDDGKPLKPIAGASVLKLDSRECFSCRLIGAGSLGLVGVYALHSSRPSQPGSVLGRRLMGGLGVCAYQSRFFMTMIHQ